jgi:chromosome segregation ATPase
MSDRGVLFAVCIGLTGLALGVGGCGGDDDQTSAEAWADDVCSAVNTWAGEVDQAAATLADPASLSVNSFENEVDRVVTASEALADDIRDLDTPDTEAAAEAEAQLERLSDDLEAQGEVLSDAISSGADSIDQLLGNVSAITGALSTLGASAQTTFEEISQLDGAAELGSAFESSETCDEARSTLEQIG